MKKTLFITGATGFIGANLISKLHLEEYKHVFCLGRTENDITKRFTTKYNFTFITGDILEPQVYSQYLKHADTIIHLAAMTGKAKVEEYFNVNCEGTKILIEQCKNYNTKQFIFISSIAVKFQNIKNYYYAQSKLKAEELVKNSGLQYTTIRPTIVVGQKFPILDSLSKLAKMPIVPIFGNGSAKIQPIFVEDLIECILYIINKGAFPNETIDLGGPEQITIEDFIKLIHELLNKNKFRSIHLPIPLLSTVLNVLEKHFLSVLPFTTGQLASFSNDGIAEKNPFLEKRSLRLKGINEMLRLSISTMVEESTPFYDLEKECSLFTNYLINQEPESYIYDKYQQGHRIVGLDSTADFFDALLIKVALKNLFFTKLTDVYTSTFYRHAVIRKKMLFLLAILECHMSTYLKIDSANETSTVFLYLKLGQKAFIFIITLILSIIIFSPIHAVSNLRLRILNRF